jgi:hypothetical protein
MTEEKKGGRARVLMPPMPEARRAPKETWELPLKLLVVGDLLKRADPRPIEDRKPLWIDSERFDKVMREQKLALPVQREGSPAELRFRGLSDMTPEAIAAQAQGPVDAILRDPRLASLVATWWMLQAAVLALAPHPNVKIEPLNASKEDLLADYEDSPEIPKSGLHKILYSGEYGSPGGRPYGAVLLDEPFSASATDLALLQHILRTAAPAHTPVVVRPTPELAASDALRALRATEEGRYLGFGYPDVVPTLAESFEKSGFCAGVEGVEPLLWVAARVAHCLKVRHRYWGPYEKTPSQMEAFHEAWLASLAADPDDGQRPFRAAHLRVTADHGYYVAFELSLDVHGGDSPGGPVVIHGRLDKE